MKTTQSLRQITMIPFSTCRSKPNHWLACSRWRSLVAAALLLISSFVAAEPATPPTSITTRPGFQVELLRSAGPDEDSWISMTFDDEGRIILGLDTAGIGRITLGDSPNATRFEKLNSTLLHCRGVLWAHQSLYVSATDSKQILRIRDRNGDGSWDEPEKIFDVDYRSRFGHGANQIVLGPDGWLYFVVGNDCSFPPNFQTNSPYRDPRKDWLLPNPHDAGHDDRVGYILKMDAQGEHREILCGGLRNPFDMAFNTEGEMFTFDADMEWDVGLPWYRPTRINHLISGGEYGWRWGTGKWPTYYIDSLPTTLDIGLGSPTGMEFGYRSQFPSPYRDALFMGDWQNGRILMATLRPRGTTYEGEYASFLEGAPLNVCDLAFGPDGAMYFITGGRGSQSGLYRVRWRGESQAPQPEPSLPDPAASAARALRRKLATFHRDPPLLVNPSAIELAWSSLSHADRWIRFSARLALERQNPTGWRDRIESSQDPLTILNATVALARVGEPGDRTTLERHLLRLNLDDLSYEATLDWCRACALVWIRHGRPDEEMSQRFVAHINRRFPDPSDTINREMTELLVYLQSVGVIDQALPLLERESTTQETQFHIAKSLLHAQRGWSTEHRARFLEWFVRARQLRGGHLLPTVLNAMQSDALAMLSATERQLHQSVITRLEKPLTAESTSELTMPIVRVWTIRDIDSLAGASLAGRSLESGRQRFVQGQCSKCHRRGDDGGQIGPDLSQVAKRLNRHDLLTAILDPSRTIDEKYRLSAYELHDGLVVTGRVTSVTDTAIKVETDPLRQTEVEILRAHIAAATPAATSPMPTGLLDIFNEDQVLDLLAFLLSSDASRAGEHPP